MCFNLSQIGDGRIDCSGDIDEGMTALNDPMTKTGVKDKIIND